MKPMGYYLKTFGHFGVAAAAFWAGVFLFPKQADRMPASATPEVHDLSGLGPADFIKQAKLKIVENAQFVRGSETYRVQLGHIYGPNRSISMCETYKNIVIIMKADGMAVHGEAPKVTLTAPCEAENAATLTNEIVIPYKELIAQKAEDGEFEYESVKIRVDHLDGEWPYQMYVDSISFMGGEGLVIDLKDIRRINRHNFTLDW